MSKKKPEPYWGRPSTASKQHAFVPWEFRPWGIRSLCREWFLSAQIPLAKSGRKGVCLICAKRAGFVPESPRVHKATT